MAPTSIGGRRTGARENHIARAIDIGWQGFALRFLAGLILVFATYNPGGYSYFHWLKAGLTSADPVNTGLASITALKAFAGIVLVVGWAIYIRAALRSLGRIGLVLATIFFAMLLWLIVEVSGMSASNIRVITYLAETLLALVLSTGLSWSHIRRRLSGQMDTDDV